MESATELVLWHEFNGKGDTSIEVLEKLCQLFSDQHGVKIRLEVMGIEELGEKLRDVVKTGAAPHMAMVPSDMSAYEKMGLFSEVPKELYEGLIPEHSLVSMQNEGRQVGVPLLTGNHLALFYNKDIYESAPQSWDEIEARSLELKPKDITPIGVDIKQSYSFIPFLTAFGGWPIKDGKPDLHTKEMEAALNFCHNQMKTGTLVRLDGATDLLHEFLSGRIGAIITGEWIYNYLQRLMGEQLGVASLPTIHGKPAISMSSSVGIIFPNQSLQSEHSELLRLFVQFMLEESSQLEWALQVNRIPVRQSVIEKLQMTEGTNNRQALMALVQSCRSMPVTPFMIAAWVGMDAGLSEMDKVGPAKAHTIILSRTEDVIREIEHFFQNTHVGA